MATNKHSCAVNLSMVLSIFQIAYLLFIGYSASFMTNRHFSSQEVDQEKATNFDHILGFVIILVALEATLFIENRNLISKYWEQELFAIKEAYKKKQGGKRSVKSDQQNQQALTKKEEKQIILRKLQYDLVKIYSRTYIILFAMKTVALILYIYEMLLSQLDWQNGSKNLDTIIQFEENDYMKLSCVLTTARLVEFVNYFFIKRWRSNIKKDIVAQLKLDSKNLRDHLNSLQGSDWAFTYNGQDAYEQEYECNDNQDIEGAPLLRQYVLQNEQKSNGSESTNTNSGKMSGSNANSNIQPQNQNSNNNRVQGRLSNASQYSHTMAKATIVL